MAIEDIKNLITRLYRFSIVGIISTIINYIFFILIYKFLFIHYIISSSMGYIIGLLAGYLLNKNWTFIERVEIRKSYLMRYTIAQIIGLLVCQFLLFIFVEFYSLSPLLANIFALGIAAFISFVLIDFYVFKTKEKNTKTDIK